MRHVITALLGATVLSIACAPGALAADMPVKAPVAASAFNWNGFYVGGHAGYGWGKSDWTWVPPGGARDVSADPKGFLGGAQLGWLHQWNNFVAGVEVTWSGGDLKDDKLQQLFAGAPHIIHTRVNSIFTATGRLGFANNNLLYYGKGGFASAQVDRSETWTGSGVVETQTRQRANGWTVGAGIDYALTSNWIAGLEYNYISLKPSDSLNVQVPGLGFAENDYINSRVAISSVVARVSYKFGGP